MVFINATIGTIHPLIQKAKLMNAHFSQAYSEARSKFVDAAKSSGAIVHTMVHPLKGPSGEALSTDIACLGNADAKNVLLVASGVHGVEGFYGSAVQTGVLTSLSPPPDTRIVLVHAINPWGWAYGRRFNENNIDLNRNFWEPGKQKPDDENYQTVQPWAEIAGLGDEHVAAADVMGQKIAASIGVEQMKIALSAGQQCSENGLFFIGHGTSWSSLTLELIVRKLLKGAEQAFFLDLHTGLGPTGFADILNDYTADSRQLNLIARYLGQHALGQERDAATAQILASSTQAGFNRWCRELNIQFIAATIECGTQPLETVMDALRLEQALYVHGHAEHARFADIKRLLRDAFYVDSTEWKAQVYEQTVGYCEGALRCIEKESFLTE